MTLFIMKAIKTIDARTAYISPYIQYCGPKALRSHKEFFLRALNLLPMLIQSDHVPCFLEIVLRLTKAPPLHQKLLK